MSGKSDVEDLENFLLSWVPKHLGEKSYMPTEVTLLPFSLREDPPSPEGSPLIELRSPLEREVNIMTQGEIDCLKKSCYFPARLQIRLPEADKIITFTCLSEVAFYEATFQVSLRLPIHPTIRRILHYYNICPAQLAPNVWRSVVCIGVVRTQNFS